MSQYQPLPLSGRVPLGFYITKYGRVWVTKDQPRWVYDTLTTGHEEETYETQLEGCGWVFPSLVTPEVITQGFERRNLERKTTSK